MDTLYCFKFDDTTGEITKIEITEYKRIIDTYTGRVHYRWNTPRINKADTHFSVTSDKMDRFVTNKVFTFKNDYDYVCGVIMRTLIEDIDARRESSLKMRDVVDGKGAFRIVDNLLNEE